MARILIGLLVIIIADVLLQYASAAGNAVVKPPIGDKEFLGFLMRGEAVTNRTISSSAIEEAISYATTVSPKAETQANNLDDQRSASAKPRRRGKESSGRVENKTQPESESPELRIVVIDSVVEGELTFRSEVPISVFFDKTVFKNEVNAYAATFTKEASFQNSTFEQGANFASATFQDVAHFVRAKFESNSWFSETDFNGRVSFAFSTANADLSFYGSTFHKGANFHAATFKGPLYFSRATIHDISDYDPNKDFAKHTDFDRAKFEAMVDFSEATIFGKITFYGSTFHNDVFFIDLNKKSDIKKDESVLEFSNVSFAGRLYFTNASVTNLFFFKIQSGDSPFTTDNEAKTAASRESVSPINFEKRAIFSGLQCNNADFTEVEFRDYVDFSRAHFFQSANFNNATFEGDVNFGETEFPANSPNTVDKGNRSLVLDHVRFQKNVDIEWSQLAGKVSPNGSETWRRLEDVFHKKGNLEGQNESMYQRLILEDQTKTGWSKFRGRFERWFWGYGVRPLRLLTWTITLFAFFTAIYWTQTKGLEVGQGRLRDKWNRLMFSIGFSSRTSWTLGYGYQHSRTRLFKVITLIHSIAFKVLLICLLKVLSNTSPLLNELIGKLVRL